jgi:hypothetical protein
VCADQIVSKRSSAAGKGDPTQAEASEKKAQRLEPV